MNGSPVFSNKITRFFSRPEIARWTRILFIIVWLLLLGSIFWYAWRNWDEIIPYFQGLKPGSLKQLWWALLAYIASLTSAILCWVAIMSVFDKNSGWKKHAQVFSLTLAARRLPGTFWYIGGRMSVYQKLGLPQKSILFASSVELVLTIVTGLSLGIIFLLGQGSALDQRIIILVIAALIIGLILVNPWTLHWYTEKLKLDIQQRISLLNILLWVFCAALMWLFSGMMLVELVSIFTTLDTSSTIFLCGAWALSGAIGLMTFFFPSSFGVTELSLTFFLSTLVPLPLATAIALFQRIVTTLFEVILSLIFLPWLSRSAISKDIAP